MTADRAVTHRGFTGHEMLDNVGLVHMNGRVYDPNLGRFLSVDPVFAFPTNTQSLNPYSYVLNNPLSVTDPTGYSPCVVDEHHSCGGDDMTGSHLAGVKTGIKGSDVADLKSQQSAKQTFWSNVLFKGANPLPGSTRSGSNGEQNSQQGAGSTIANGLSQAKGTNNGTATQAATVNGTAGSKGDLQLSDQQKQQVLQNALVPYDPNNPREAHQDIFPDGSQRDRETAGCVEDRCPTYIGAIITEHWHVNVRYPDDLTQAQANLTREFPGPGDHIPLSNGMINVGVTPMGAVWAIERVNGALQLNYLRHSSDPYFDNFVKAHWMPGMSTQKISDEVKRHDQ